MCKIQLNPNQHWFTGATWTMLYPALINGRLEVYLGEGTFVSLAHVKPQTVYWGLLVLHL